MIYLDHAATSFPKPPAVVREVTRCLREYGGNPGRGSHRLAMLAAEKIYECREEIASFFGSPSPENVVFTPNATAAINLAVKGLLRQGDHVLISDLEHNAVRRPICRLEREGRITYSVFPSGASDPCATAEQICRGLEERILPNTRMVICAHASNICSAVLPLREIGALCRARGILLVVDASQSAGHFPIRMEELGADVLCAPGHKGLLGPQGSGFLLFGEGIYAEPLLEGGSGVHSLEETMPEESPERYEAGTLSTPAIAGLCEGIRAVRRLSLDAIAEREADRISEIKERLLELPRVRLYAPHLSGGILLFSVTGIPADAVGEELNRRGICVRSGFHCAPLAHQTLGSFPDGGVRVSVGYTTKRADADALWRTIKEITKA